MSVRIPAALLAAAFASAGPALAQDAPQTGAESNIVVTGAPDREEEIRDFVGALTRTPRSQLSRFDGQICPAVFGLSGPLREGVLNRMRRVTRAVGLRVAPARCTPNLLLMVTRDKRALIETLARRYPAFFGEDRASRPSRILSEPGPAAAWHAEAQVNADGRALDMEGGFYVNRTTRQATRAQAAARPTFVAAAVVVEREALIGLSTTQLADYALMRALARTDPHALPASSPPTILKVLEAPAESEVPTTLTRWDLGFLRGLYASQANLHAGAQRGEIRRSVGAELQRPDGDRD
jgi:hypothetical protein